MNHKERVELEKSLLFFRPWCEWHLDDCVQGQSFVEWYKDEAQERISYAVFQLNETMSRNVETGDLFSLKFWDGRGRIRKAIEVKGTIQEFPDSLKSGLSYYKPKMLKFLDKSSIYSIRKSDNVTITNMGLYSCYKKQLDYLKKIIKRLAEDNILSKIFMSKRRKISDGELNSENRIKDATYAPEFHSDCNDSQRYVIDRAVNNRVTLVKGPPGTGKTFTSAVITLNLHKTKKKGSKILICTSSNVALDNIAIKILELYEELKLVRIRSIRSQQNNTTKMVGQLYLDDILMKEEGDLFERYRLLLANEQAQLGDLIHLEKSLELRSLEEECERTIIRKADVLCTTCCGASRISRLFEESLEIDSLVIDECSQVSQPEALLPVIFCPRRVVVVGDDKQLGVVIRHEVKDSLPQYSNERLSLFEILKKRGLKPTLLNVQYRMHPFLLKFPNMFYNNEIKNGLDHEDRQWSDPKHKSPFPRQDMPLYFHCHNHQESQNDESKSRFNMGEVNIVAETIKVLLSRGVAGGMIGVITPYRDQCKEINNKLNQMCRATTEAISNKSKTARRTKASRKQKKFITDSNHIEVATVDAYQGREKDYIILSMVRSSEKGKPSFVADKKRLNVSLTRAKFGMVIIGNPAVLKRAGLLRELILHASRNKLLYDRVLSETAKGMDLNTFERLHSLIRIPASFSNTFCEKDK